MKLLVGTISALALLGATGCRSIGPSTVKRDRLHYSTAVSDSWKEQLLLNLVKTRYGDAPAFLEVLSVVSGYTLEAGVSASGQFSPENLSGDTFVGGGLSGRFADHPTISYAPMNGEKFTRSLITPVPLDALLSVIQGGTPADLIMGLTVQTIEGHRNMGMYGGQFQPADPGFIRLLELLRSLQRTQEIETEVIEQGNHFELWIRFHLGDPSMTTQVEQVTELKMILGVPPKLDRAKIVFGTIAPEPEVIAMRTRSLIQILSTLGIGVEIPQDHLAKGSAIPVEESFTLDIFKVRSGKKKPDEAFAAVPYEGNWFWIDKQDLSSKTLLSAVTVLFNFLEGDSRQGFPVLTIPTN